MASSIQPTLAVESCVKSPPFDVLLLVHVTGLYQVSTFLKAQLQNMGLSRIGMQRGASHIVCTPS